MNTVRSSRNESPAMKRLLVAAFVAGGGFLPLDSFAAANCFFRAVGTLTISFGNLDPSVGSNAAATMTVGTFRSDQVGNCTTIAQTMTLTAGNGMNYFAGSRRLASAGNFIPYTITGAGAGWAGTGPWTRNKPGNTAWRTMPTLTANILGVNYQNAAVGTYTDTVMVTISP
jgi:spore coat protein U-like protein